MDVVENCPHCGLTLSVRKWNDDYGMIEIKKACSCGYIYHWAYGTVIEDSDRKDDER